MIHSKFGTALSLVSNTENANGKVSMQATSDGTPDVHEYNVTDVKADDVMTEINAAVAKLPVKVYEKRQQKHQL